MRYLNSSELSQFHDSFMAMCEKHATTKDEEGWGFPGGVHDCDTYSFNIGSGILKIGHSNTIVANRWWIPLSLESQAYVFELAIAFEMNIPKTHNMHVSIHYAINDDNEVHILHKGKVTARHGLSMYDFFEYYRKNPGRWPVISFSGYEYLELGKINMVITDIGFKGLLDSLADFAKYIPGFKDKYR